MENNDCIRFLRKSLDNPIICKDVETFAVWIYLFLNAAHQETETVFGGKHIVLNPGQLVTSRAKIAMFFNISESKVQRVLKWLETERQIEQQTSVKNRLISMVDWDFKRKTEQQIERQLNDKGQTKGKQGANEGQQLKKEKKEKKEKKYPPLYPPTGEFDERFNRFWEAYPRKCGKQNARKAFAKIAPDEDLMVMLLTAIEAQKKSDQWTRGEGQYIPYPATWLNGRRWEDELAKPEQEGEQYARFIPSRR